jgi:hypothetical protein
VAAVIAHLLVPLSEDAMTEADAGPLNSTADGFSTYLEP